MRRVSTYQVDTPCTIPAVTEIPIVCRWHSGDTTRAELTVHRLPCDWTADDACEFVHAMQHALTPTAVYALRLVETSPARRWQVVVEATTGTATSAKLELSAAALAWLESVEFALPNPGRAH
jgi:hypothetical protein